MYGHQQIMTRLGITNKDWGVCGFTSSFYAMYDLNPATRPQIITATAAYRVLAEIKTYLMMLKAEGSDLLNKITEFTRTFGEDFEDFTVDTYIAEINKAAAMGKSRFQILSDPKFSIALPPDAVADYIRRIWDWKTKITEFAVGTGGGDGIIGVSSSEYDEATGVKKLYHGLEHYMYRSGGKVYSWGKEFSSVQNASRGGAGGVLWRVCYEIAITRP